jgi:hypothetical protein
VTSRLIRSMVSASGSGAPTASGLGALGTSRRVWLRSGCPTRWSGVLVGGPHGRPRATKDVDYLVGPEAFTKTRPLLVYRDELAALVSIGQVDLLAVPYDHPELVAMLEVPSGGGVSVLPVEAIVLLKLIANRPRTGPTSWRCWRQARRSRT